MSEYYEKLNDLNNKWEEKFKNFKKNYENKYKQISLKIDNELPLDKIIGEINNELTPDNLMKMIKIIELKNKIGYYTFILNLQNKYNDDYEKIDEINKEKIKNLKKYVVQRFDDIIKEDKVLDKNIGKKNNENIINKLDVEKRNLNKDDLVNFESGLNINKNNLSVSKSISINQDRLSSDLENFNFNDDSIPNKEIQVLSPMEQIK